MKKELAAVPKYAYYSMKLDKLNSEQEMIIQKIRSEGKAQRYFKRLISRDIEMPIYVSSDRSWNCPACGYKYHFYYDRFKFCKVCGQRVGKVIKNEDKL